MLGMALDVGCCMAYTSKYASTRTETCLHVGGFGLQLLVPATFGAAIPTKAYAEHTQGAKSLTRHHDVCRNETLNH